MPSPSSGLQRTDYWHFASIEGVINTIDGERKDARKLAKASQQVQPAVFHPCPSDKSPTHWWKYTLDGTQRKCKHCRTVEYPERVSLWIGHRSKQEDQEKRKSYIRAGVHYPCHCLRCNHHWEAFKPNPKVCARCTSPKWKEPRS